MMTNTSIDHTEAAVEYLAEKIYNRAGYSGYLASFESVKRMYRTEAREWLNGLVPLLTAAGCFMKSLSGEVAVELVRKNFPSATNIQYHELPHQGDVYRNSAGEAFDPQPGHVKTPPVLGDGKGPKFSEGAFPGMSIVHDPQPGYVKTPPFPPYGTVIMITRDMVLDYAPAPFTWLDRYQAVWSDGTTGTVLRDFHTGKIYKDDRQGPSGILSGKDGGLTVGDDPWVEKEAVCPTGIPPSPSERPWDRKVVSSYLGRTGLDPVTLEPTGIVTKPPHEVDTMDVSIEKLLAIQEDLKAKGYPVDKSVELPRKEG